ncbi:MAG TPA: YciI family protein [Polyangiales bacterium]|nr:YciI family protein [Polyangiales bacterium]
MRFMTMHKHSKATEAGELPSPEQMEQMGAYIAEKAESGEFLGGEGLGASATRTRLVFRDGRCTIKRGPYTGAHELIASTMLIHVQTLEQAIGWAERYGKVLVDGELEIAPVTEEWDLGFMAKPDDAPLRVLMLVKADASAEAGQPRSAKQKGDLTRLQTEMKKAGVLVSSEILKPSSDGKRLHFRDGTRRIFDGPFTESKELIGGFSILELSSIDVALAECARFANILGGELEVDVRPLYEPGEAP